MEKGVDIRIAVDMLQFAQRGVYDTAILVTGDGDFAYAVKAVKDLGKDVESACTRRGQARVLRGACDRFVDLDEGFLRDVFLP